MKLNSIERAAVNNPVRAAHQHHREAAWFRRLGRRIAWGPARAGSRLRPRRRSEVTPGSGWEQPGSQRSISTSRWSSLRVDVYTAARSTCPSAMHARSNGRRGPVDAVVDFGIIHHVPDWQQAVLRDRAGRRGRRVGAVRGDPPVVARHLGLSNVDRPSARKPFRCRRVRCGTGPARVARHGPDRTLTSVACCSSAPHAKT